MANTFITADEWAAEMKRALESSLDKIGMTKAEFNDRLRKDVAWQEQQDILDEADAKKEGF